jgi:hypothetical protein
MKLLFWKRCFLCKEYDDVRKLRFDSWECSWNEYYHEKCIEECLCHPEDKTSRQLNIAKDIVQRIKEIRGRRKRLVESVENLCEEVIGER